MGILRKINSYLAQSGQGMVEYALIIAFVVAVAVYFTASTSPLGSAISSIHSNAASAIVNK